MVLGVVAATSAQLVDDFSCPDEFAGYYPHLIRQAWMCGCVCHACWSYCLATCSQQATSSGPEASFLDERHQEANM